MVVSVWVWNSGVCQDMCLYRYDFLTIMDYGYFANQPRGRDFWIFWIIAILLYAYILGLYN